MSEFVDINEALDFTLKTAETMGASQCEGFITDFKTIALEVEKGRPTVENGYNKGISIRVIANNNIGFSFTTSFTKESISHSIQQAVSNAKARESEAQRISFPQPGSSTSIPYDASIEDITIEEIGEYYDQFSQTCEKSKYNFLGGQVQHITGHYGVKNTNGVNINEKIGLIGGGGYILSTKGLIPSWTVEVDFSRKKGGVDWENLGDKLIREIIRLQNPKTINFTGEVPVIFEPKALGGLFGGLLTVLTHMLRGDSIFRGASYFVDRIGEDVGVEHFSISDYGNDERCFMPTAYDMEGVPSSNLPLIEKGVLKNYLLDNTHAIKMGMDSNGKCTRFPEVGYNPIKQFPRVGIFTTVIGPGDSTVEEMILETKKGFMINNIMGVHMSDYASGRFAVTGSGWYVENGTIKYPVQDISISGNIPELIKNIDLIGKDQEVSMALISPHFRVKSLNIVAQKMNAKYRLMLRMLKILTTLKLMKNPIVAD